MADRVPDVPPHRSSPVVTPDTQPASPHLLSMADVRAASIGREVTAYALVTRCDVAQDRHGRPYLMLTFHGTDGGAVEGRWWRYPYPPDRLPGTGCVCRVIGMVEAYRGNPQIRIREMRPAPDTGVELFVRSARTDIDTLREELEDRIRSLEPGMGTLVRGVLAGSVYDRFCTWPAAHSRHGAVRHGLLAHSLGVVRLAERLAEAYGARGMEYDRHIVTAACLLHDVGKVDTLPPIPGGVPPDAAHRADHVTRSVLLVHAAACALASSHLLPPERLEQLLHAILAHHGRKEWGAPVEPRTIEAWLVHLADYAESRLWKWSGEEGA